MSGDPYNPLSGYDQPFRDDSGSDGDNGYQNMGGDGMTNVFGNNMNANAAENFGVPMQSPGEYNQPGVTGDLFSDMMPPTQAQ